MIPNQQNPAPEPPKKKKAGAIIIVVVLVVLIIVGILGYLSYQNVVIKPKEEAKAYLTLQADAYKDVINSVNELETETELPEDVDVPQDLVQEVDDLEKELEEIQRAIEKTETAQNKSNPLNNKHIGGLSKDMDVFYKDLNNQVVDYKELYEYKLKISQARKAAYDNGVNQLFDVLTAIVTKSRQVTDEEFKAALTAGRDSISTYLNELEGIASPEGLTDYHDYIVKENQQLKGDLDLVLEKFDATSEEFKAAFGAFYTNLEKDTTDDAEEKLFSMYQEEMGDKFGELRKRADDIKSKMTEKKTELQASFETASIDNW